MKVFKSKFTKKAIFAALAFSGFTEGALASAIQAVTTAGGSTAVTGNFINYSDLATALATILDPANAGTYAVAQNGVRKTIAQMNTATVDQIRGSNVSLYAAVPISQTTITNADYANSGQANNSTNLFDAVYNGVLCINKPTLTADNTTYTALMQNIQKAFNTFQGCAPLADVTSVLNGLGLSSSSTAVTGSSSGDVTYAVLYSDIIKCVAVNASTASIAVGETDFATLVHTAVTNSGISLMQSSLSYLLQQSSWKSTTLKNLLNWINSADILTGTSVSGSNVASHLYVSASGVPSLITSTQLLKLIANIADQITTLSGADTMTAISNATSTPGLGTYTDQSSSHTWAGLVNGALFTLDSSHLSSSQFTTLSATLNGKTSYASAEAAFLTALSASTFLTTQQDVVLNATKVYLASQTTKTLNANKSSPVITSIDNVFNYNSIVTAWYASDSSGQDQTDLTNLLNQAISGDTLTVDYIVSQIKALPVGQLSTYLTASNLKIFAELVRADLLAESIKVNQVEIMSQKAQSYGLTSFPTANKLSVDASAAVGISSYATSSSVTTALQPYATSASVTTALQPYATSASVTTALVPYAKTTDLQNYGLKNFPTLTAGSKASSGLDKDMTVVLQKARTDTNGTTVAVPGSISRAALGQMQLTKEEMNRTGAAVPASTN